jgi:hypothetical protein
MHAFSNVDADRKRKKKRALLLFHIYSTRLVKEHRMREKKKKSAETNKHPLRKKKGNIYRSNKNKIEVLIDVSMRTDTFRQCEKKTISFEENE